MSTAFLTSVHSIFTPRPQLVRTRCTRAHGTRRGVSRAPIRAVISEKSPNESTTEEASPSKRSVFDWREQWYAVIPERDAPKSEPHAFTLFDHELVLFRVSEREWSVLDDTCPHRLAPLSEGRITRATPESDAEIECAYHGWRFNGCGGCTCIPQLEEGAKIPRRATVRRYATKVQVGVIWVYFGEPSNAERTPTPLPAKVLEMEQVVGSPQPYMRMVPYSMETLLENVADPEHVNYAHHGASPDFNRKNGGKRTLVAERTTPSQISCTITFERKPGEVRRPTSVLNFPGVVCYEANIPRVGKVVTTIIASPAERAKTRVILIGLTKFVDRRLALLTALTPRWLVHLNISTVLDGDNVFLRGVDKAVGEPANWKSKFLPAPKTDAFILEIRKWMDQHRDSMPWLTKFDPLLHVERTDIIERWHSHTKYSTISRGAHANFARALVVAEIVAQIAAVALLSVVVTKFVGVSSVLASAELRTTAMVIGVLVVILAIAVLVRQVCAWFKEQFELTEKAHHLRQSA